VTVLANREQRWRERRSRFVVPDRVFVPAQCEVALIADDTSAKAFVERHHYEASFPVSVRRVGMYRRGELVGVAVFAVPVRPCTLDCLPGGRDGGVSLSRLVLLDDVEFNAESWFIARAFELLRQDGFTGVVSFSDPLPRRTTDGTLLLRGHYGCVYQGSGGTYLGRSKPDTMRILPDGRTFDNRAIAKIRQLDSRWRYAAAKLERFGATPLVDLDRREEWLEYWMTRLCRQARHPGKHKYLWALDPKLRRHLPTSKPYPKQIDREVTWLPVRPRRTRRAGRTTLSANR